ncbi:flagellar hook-associated protein FlgK [Clostridium sp. Cult1]|uniref:flagellar hook-associated protein FlgK n=1 Tax=Clostridium sp. Cult1 TaxID=2079002 RepID=UPI001F0009AF|nr:flagellar hook-associated protein FlgK [Clostridium sp. Cult1]MCF6463969.1 flagellar hook-associated protein FlgK [Clostridium sp. Cult1]
MHFGFNTAVQALLASQRSLYITNHNISNMNTEGYSRQQGAQRATSPYNLPGIGYLGTGTEIYDIARVRDSYVDFKYWNENAPKGEWLIKRDTLSEIEKLFGEPSKSSFRQYLDDFYTALDNMSKNPSDFSYREPVRENALAFTKHINESAARLAELKKETEVSIDTKVRKINSIATQIASLNRQIYSNELDGRKANDLRDRRDLLVDELSQIVNVKVDESKDGKFRVNISGVSLVDHTDANFVKTDTDDKDNIVIKWSNGGTVNLRAGELKGLLELYNGDGKNNSYRGIPYYQRKLDDFAKGFAEAFNEQHEKGYKLNSTENGGEFFHISDPDNPAATITLSDAILDNLENIAAAGASPGNAEDNRNLLELIALRDNGEFFDGIIGTDGNPLPKGTPDDFLKSIISNLAVDSMQGQRMYDTQNLILKNIESKRDSISGVSYDEEMADMVKFQHTYVASARMITTMDTIMDVTINRLGLVGR